MRSNSDAILICMVIRLNDKLYDFISCINKENFIIFNFFLIKQSNKVILIILKEAFILFDLGKYTLLAMSGHC